MIFLDTNRREKEMTDAPALSFGEELRRESVVREISLEEISSATKISIRLLKALEESDLSRLPAPTFTRGFIRAYAMHLGIDPEEKVNAYLADLAGASARGAVGKTARPRSRFWRGRRATAGTIVGGVTGVSSVPRADRQPRAPPAAAARARRAARRAGRVEERGPLERADSRDASRPPAAGAAASPLPERAVPADQASRLLLEFDADSWTQLEADGQHRARPGSSDDGETRSASRRGRASR